MSQPEVQSGSAETAAAPVPGYGTQSMSTPASVRCGVSGDSSRSREGGPAGGPAGSVKSTIEEGEQEDTRRGDKEVGELEGASHGSSERQRRAVEEQCSASESDSPASTVDEWSIVVFDLETTIPSTDMIEFGAIVLSRTGMEEMEGGERRRRKPAGKAWCGNGWCGEARRGGVR